MNSDLMPSPESSNQPQTNTEPAANVQTVAAQAPAAPVPKVDNSSVNSSETASNGNLANRQQPIPPPSEPMQYRAIGLVRGRYHASSEQFTQGTLLTADGVQLNA